MKDTPILPITHFESSPRGPLWGVVAVLATGARVEVGPAVESRSRAAGVAGALNDARECLMDVVGVVGREGGGG